MKRFWEAALAVPRLEGGYGVVLDGRPLRLPGGNILTTERRPLAEAIAEEWHKAGGIKGGEMRQDDVPLTRLLGAAQERIAPAPKPMVEGLAKYGETDLLCYRAEDHRLAARQAEGAGCAAQHHPGPDAGAASPGKPGRASGRGCAA